MDKWLISKTKTSGDSEDAGSTAAGQPSGRMETTETKHSQRKKRKYTETYLQYGFTFTDIHNEQRPICLICNAVLASESMKPAKLKRHLDTNHASYANKPVEYFERLLQSTKKQKSYMEAHVFTNSKHLQASYEASYLIAKAKKPFTIGEELALPIAIRITEIINGKKYADELRKIPMSDTTIAKMDFYYLNLSPPCRSVLLTAKAVGVTLNKKVLNVMEKEQLKPEFVAINPQHCIPTLVDGDLKLWESRAICTYLVAQYGKDECLYPKDPKTRAEIDRLLYFDMGTFYSRFMGYAYPVMFEGAKPEPAKLEVFHEALGWFNGFLEGHDFAVGNSITVADFVLIASVSSFIEAGIDFSKCPNVSAWAERCKNQMTGYETDNGEGAKEFGGFFKSKCA